MKKKLIITIIASILLFVNSYVFATTLTLNTDYTEEYKKYLMSSEEDKAKYTIIPNQYKITEPISKEKNPISLMNTLGAGNDPYYSLKDIMASNIIIKNQKNLTLCWGFATLSALSTNLALKNITKTYDFSARHMDYAAVKDTANGANTNPYGLNRAPGSTANWGVAINYLTNGLGAISESSMPLNYSTDLVPLSDITGKQSITEVYDVKMYPMPTSTDERNSLITEVKTNIRNHGAVPAQICGENLNNNEYYNESTGALYYPSSADVSINHAVAIIGWDDNYAISNFNSNHIPPEKGAWIVQNSWGTEVGDNGLIYISYYDKFVNNGLIQIMNAADKNSYTFNKKYDNSYIHDNQGFGPAYNISGTNKAYLASQFTMNNTSEFLSMVSIAVLNNCQCKVYVNTQDSDLNSSKFTAVKLKSGEYTANLDPGYHSIEFEKPIEITSASKNFAVVVELTNQSQNNNVNIFVEKKYTDGSNTLYSNVDISGKCFVADEAGFTQNSWTDLKTEINSDLTLRAYTLNEAPPQKSLTGINIVTGPNKTNYNIGENFDRTGMVVEAIFSDYTFETITDYVVSNGSNLQPGQTSVTISYNGFTEQQNITVNGNNPSTNTIPSNTIPTNTVPPSNTIPTNTIPTNTIPTNTIPTNNIPDNSTSGGGTTGEPQNSSLNNLRASITKLTKNSIILRVENFIPNMQNDSLSYSFYLTPYKNESLSTLTFMPMKAYQINSNTNTLEFAISDDQTTTINSKYDWDNEENCYLIIKEMATLGSNTKTAYSNFIELDISDDFTVLLDEETPENRDYSSGEGILGKDTSFDSLLDDTVAKTPIPQTGVKSLILIVALISTISIVLISRYIIIKRTFDGK